MNWRVKFKKDTIIQILIEIFLTRQIIESLIMKPCFQWPGHVAKMKELRFPHQVLFSEFTSGKRPWHCPF